MNLPFDLSGVGSGDDGYLFRVLLVLMIIGSTSGQDDIVKIGPELRPVFPVIENAEGSTFLMNDAVLGQGILFAFSAFFVNPSRIFFQVWRPVSVNGSSDSAYFQLVFQTSMVPTTTGKREDLYVVSTLKNRCPMVRNGDKVGVFFPLGAPAISRFFDLESPNTFRYESPNASIPPEVNRIVHFDTLPFPYKLNVQAWILLGDGRGTKTSPEEDDEMYAQCPRVFIPDRSNEEVTISPGATGATGPVGARGPLGATGRDGGSGDRGATGALGPIGATGNTGPQGATGAVGPSGDSGSSGSQGLIGATGLMGETGSSGPTGPVGLPGPPGPLLQMKSPDASLSSSACSGSMMSEGFLIAMLIWLVLLTLLLMTILVGTVVLCVELRSRREKQDENELIDLSRELNNSVDTRSLRVQNGAAILHPNEYEFIEEQPQATDLAKLRMRDETISNFPLETIETTKEEDLLWQRKQSGTTLLSEMDNPIFMDDDNEASEKPQTNDGTMTTKEEPTKTIE